MSPTTPFLEQWKKDAQALFDRLASEALFGRPPRKQRETALAFRGGTFVSLEIGDDGKVIEPCPYCGPVLLCSKHMLMVT